MLELGRINVLIGNSWGSEGKGNISAYIAETCSPDICISNNGMNAGHCYLDDNEEKQVLKVLPVSGILSKDSTIILGAGSAFTTKRLFEEIEKFGVADRLVISPTASVITEECIELERKNLRYISSTMQGVGAAFAMKAMRAPETVLAKDVDALKPFIRYDIPEMLINMVEGEGLTALAEVAQGIGLTVDNEFYPYCTSRPVNVGQMFGYMDVPIYMIGNVIGVARSYPIRVGGVDNFTSGNVYDDSKEITWEELSDKLGKNVKELTTVTKRVRRVFTFSKKGFERGVRRNGINVCFLSFADYLNFEEVSEMAKYLKSPEHEFDAVYMVFGFGDFENNVRNVWEEK